MHPLVYLGLGITALGALLTNDEKRGTKVAKVASNVPESTVPATEQQNSNPSETPPS